MKRLTYLLILSALLLGVAESALAQTFAVKGVLRDPLGRTVNDGTYTIVFKLYTAETGGTALWTETHGSVPTKHGVFGVELGTVTALTGVSFVDNYWLGIQVEGEQEMTPRIKLLTNPYSLAVKGEDNRFPSTGNVGIGTTTASSKLTVIGDIEISGSRLHVNANGNVGVGTATPASKLTVAGDVEIDGSRFHVGANGNVGVGTATPGQKLEVNGALKLSNTPSVTNDNSAAYFWNQNGIGPTIAGSQFEVRTGGDTPRLQVNQFGGFIFPTVGEGFVLWGENDTFGSNQDGRIFQILDTNDTGGAPDGGILFEGYTSTDNVRKDLLAIRGNGNIGIGTRYPNAKLSLGAEVNNQLLGLWDSSNSDEWYGFGIAPGLLRIQAAVGAGLGVFLGATNEVVRINSNGRVGIGTVNPAQPLEVNGNIKVNGNLIFSDNTSFSSAALGGAASSVTNPADVPITSGGRINVSVGNSGSGFTPHNNTSVSIYNNLHNFISLLTPNTHASGIYFGDPENNTIGEISYHNATNTMNFYSNGAYRLTIKEDGKVGIGTTTPGGLLEVADGAGDATRYGALQVTRPGDNGGDNKLHLSLIRAGHFVGGLGYVPNADQWGLFNTNTDTPIMLFDGTGSINFPRMGEGLWLWSDDNAFGTFEDGRIFQIRDTNNSGGAPDGGLIIEGYTSVDDVHKDLMAIRGSGLVGIGTRLPATRLHVVNGSSGQTPHGNSTMAIDNNGHNFISLLTPNSFASGLYFGDPESPTVGQIGYHHSSNSFWFDTNSATRMTIDANGFLGLGTASPATRLHVVNGSSGQTPHGNTTMTIDNNGHNFISLLTPNTHASGIYFGDPENRTSAELAYTHDTNTFQIYANGAYRFLIDSSGNVGIGATSPTAGLDVQNGPSFTVPANGYLDVAGNVGTTGSTSRNVSIRASGFVVGQEFAAVSDARIKNVIGVSSGKQDLETIEQLEVVDYTYIDVVGKGNRPNKKLVAQQVREVYPLAVNAGTDFIPNVYQMSASTEFDAENGRLIIGTEKKHGFAVDDTVRIADDEGMEEMAVRQVIDAHTFAIDRDEQIERVFVYGKRVDDFLSVNYEAVSMLNVSATQELSRRVEDLETSNASLQADNAALKETLTRYQTLEGENAVLRAQMLHFESALQQLQEKVAAGDTGEKRESADDELSMTD